MCSCEPWTKATFGLHGGTRMPIAVRQLVSIHRPLRRRTPRCCPPCLPCLLTQSSGIFLAVQRMSMLSAHIDTSPVLSRPLKLGAASTDYIASMTTWMDPFSYEVWVALLALIFTSGVVDYLLEREHGGTLSASIYEYSGGVLWGGFQNPHTKLSAVYQVVAAFVILVTISAYTANLASVMTLSSLPTFRISSVDDVISANHHACVVGSYDQTRAYNTLFPRLRLDTTMAASEIDDAMRYGVCEASIVPRIDFDTWRTHGPNCHIEIAPGGSFWFAGGSWATNLQSERCVPRAIDWAMQRLRASGELSELLRYYLPVAECAPDEVEVTAVDDACRRRLSEVDASVHEPFTPPQARSPLRRRLKSGPGADGADVSSAASSTSPSMQLVDFFGIFFLWGVATATVLGIHATSLCVQRCSERLRRRQEEARVHPHASRRRTKQQSEEDKQGLAALRIQASFRGQRARREVEEKKSSAPVLKRKDTGLITKGLDNTFGVQGAKKKNYPKGLNVGDNSAMLKYLVLSVGTLMEQVESIEATAGPLKEAVGSPEIPWFGLGSPTKLDPLPKAAVAQPRDA